MPVGGVLVPLEACRRSLGNYYKRTGSSGGLLRRQPERGEVLLQAASSVCWRPGPPVWKPAFSWWLLATEGWSVQSMLQCLFFSEVLAAPSTLLVLCPRPHGPECQLFVQVQDLHLLPPSRLPWRLFWGEGGGWVIVTEHCIHTYSLCFVEGNFPRLILKGVILLLMHGVFVCFLTS